MNFQEMFELSRGRRKAESGKLKPLPYDQSAKLNRPLDVLAPTTGTYGEAATRMVPMAGEAWAVDDARKELAQGNYGAAAAAAALGFLPFGGTLAALRSGAKPFTSGASTMLTSGGKAAARSPGRLPHAEDVQGFHWSNESNLNNANPAMYGRGIKGAEADRLAGQGDIRPRSYFYNDETMREAGLGSNQYTGTLKDVYPGGDPLRLWEKFGGDANAIEREIKRLGYKGYERGKTMVAFEQTPVSRHVAGTAPAPAAVAKPAITDATEVQVGSLLNTRPLSPEDEAKRMAWLERSNNVYRKMGLNPESRVVDSSYINPEGVRETNKALVTDLPYSPEAEKAVDFVSMFRNAMLGQNARGGIGVTPNAADDVALRMNLSPADMGKVPEIMAKSEAAGVYGVPSTEGLTFIGPEGMTQDALYRHAHDLANQGNLTRPSAYQGGASSIYKELPWESTGGTYTPGQGTVTREHLIPRIESNPDLTKQIELTGEIPQLARGVLATENVGPPGYSGASEQLGTLPADVILLNQVLKEGGLENLAKWVREKGYAGLPAVGGIGLTPMDNRDR